MDQLKCRGCGSPLTAGDRFCDNCGTTVQASQRPAPWPGTVKVAAGQPGMVKVTAGELNGEQEAAAAPDDPSHPFFRHPLSRPARFLSDATRYLCAAAYLDERFADDVIWELVASHRAVAPSVDIDVGPIIRHCLHSRRIRLIRDVALAVIVLAALYFMPLATVDFLLVSLSLGVILPKTRWRQRTPVARMLIAFAYVVVFGTIGVFLIYQILGVFILAAALNSSQSTATTHAGLSGLVLSFAGLVAVMWATQFSYLYSALRTLTEHLRPGAEPLHIRHAAAARIAAVEAAQWGNLTLYGGENPFIGTGQPFGDWSIAIELDRARPRQDITARKKTQGYVPVDPVELHDSIRERLLKLNDPDLPPNERIFGLTVDDAVVGSGLLRWNSPLLDLSGRTPYSEVAGEAIDALKRHPQAALRYYQRVSVSDEGPPVTAAGRQVIAGVNQGIAVSAFIYVAVEGRMFYLQFVRRALPPVRREYQIIDFQPDQSNSRFWTMTLWRAFKTMFAAVMYSPRHLYTALRIGWRERRFEREFSPSDGSVVKDFGTQISIRQHGAEDDFSTHLESLDVEKYTKIIERLLLDTVLDFLAGKGVDTSAFAASAGAIINGDIINVDTVYGSGNQIGGRGNTMQAAQAPPGS